MSRQNQLRHAAAAFLDATNEVTPFYARPRSALPAGDDACNRALDRERQATDALLALILEAAGGRGTPREGDKAGFAPAAAEVDGRLYVAVPGSDRDDVEHTVIVVVDGRRLYRAPA